MPAIPPGAVCSRLCEFMVYLEQEKTVAIIQARMGSLRMPDKIIRPFSAGLNMLELVIRRVKRCPGVNSVVVAYPNSPESKSISRIAAMEGVLTFRGSEEDVLDRVYRAALGQRAGIVARVCAHNPLTDPEALDRCINAFKQTQTDLLVPAGLPAGVFAEILSFNALQHAWDAAKDPVDREHFMRFIFRDTKNITRRELKWEPTRWIDNSFTVDTEQDFRKVDNVIHRSRGDGVWVSLDNLKQ